MLTEEFLDIFKKGEISGEQHIPFINKGAIEDFPDDVIMELPVRVDSERIHREEMEPNLTDRVKRFYMWPKVLRIEWNLEAFFSRDKRVLEEILIRDPRTRSYEQVVKALDEILSLPFNEEIRKHYEI